ncbi:DMT family transporter [Sneathiella sp.]|uniref:DMT family transporter n=1 Tax=Sneathiella sp. TaxID=1964365 RepID=UPI00356651E5
MDNSETIGPKTENLKAYLLLVLTTICWAMNAVLGRFAVGEVSPIALVSLRWFGVVLLLSLFAFKYVREDWMILRKHLLYFFCMGALGFTGFNMLFYLAAHSTTAVNIGILQGSIPVFVLLGAFLALKTRVTPLQMVGVAFTVSGVIIVGAGGSLEQLANFEFNRGDVMMLGACALYAGYTVTLRDRPKVSALAFFALMAIAAFLTSVPFVLIEISLGQFQAPTTTGWIVIAIVVLFPSFIAQIAFIKGVGILGPGRAGVFVNLVPIFAAIMAVTFLDEPFKFYHGVALGLVLFGIWLSERGKPA